MTKRLELDPAVENKLWADIEKTVDPDYTLDKQRTLYSQAVKDFLGEIKIVPGDCGTRNGVQVSAIKEHRTAMIGYSIVTDTGYETLTEENVDNYSGTEVTIRSPIFCEEKSPHGCCEVCYGPRKLDTEL